MKPKTKQLLSVNNAWLFYHPIKSFFINGQPNAACLTASHDTETGEISQREIKSDRSRMECLVDKELALFVVWRRAKWYSKDDMCDGDFFQLTMELCALKRKCSARKRQSSVSSVLSACHVSAESTCRPISARPWQHHGAISRSSVTVNQNPVKGKKSADKFSRCVGGEWLCKHISCRWISSRYIWLSMVQRTLNCLFNDLSLARAIRALDFFSAKVNNKNHAY